MSAHHGPPCGHTVLGTCAGCGGRAPMRDVGWTAPTNQTRTYGPVTVAAKAASEARRRFDHLARQREDEALLQSPLEPIVFAELAKAGAVADKARTPSVVVDLEEP